MQGERRGVERKFLTRSFLIKLNVYYFFNKGLRNCKISFPLGGLKVMEHSFVGGNLGLYSLCRWLRAKLLITVSSSVVSASFLRKHEIRLRKRNFWSSLWMMLHYSK